MSSCNVIYPHDSHPRNQPSDGKLSSPPLYSLFLFRDIQRTLQAFRGSWALKRCPGITLSNWSGKGNSIRHRARIDVIDRKTRRLQSFKTFSATSTQVTTTKPTRKDLGFQKSGYSHSGTISVALSLPGPSLVLSPIRRRGYQSYCHMSRKTSLCHSTRWSWTRSLTWPIPGLKKRPRDHKDTHE